MNFIKNIIKVLIFFVKSIFGVIKNIFIKILSLDNRLLKKYTKEAENVMILEKDMELLWDSQLKQKTEYFKKLLDNND